MILQLCGCSHHQTAVESRERLAFDAAQIETALDALRRQYPRSEAVVLSTCNRVEVYTASEDPDSAPSHDEVVRFLAEFHAVKPEEIFEDLFQRNGEDAVAHLFTVASGLDSMVVGEPQILSQVKAAYELARGRDSAGPLIHAAFQGAIRAAKRVASETAIARRRVSIPSVAIADYASQIFERFDDKKVLLIGAGEMGEETLRYLQDEGTRDVTVVNRSADKAEQLAARFGGRAAAWDRLHDELTAADLVISTTAAREPILTLSDYRKIESQRYQRPLFILDLAIPRDFDPAIGEHGLAVYLYSIDDLRAACDRNRQQREKELPAAMRIIEAEVADFMTDLNRRATGPIIQRLKQGWRQPMEDELRRLYNKLPELDDQARAEIEQSFGRLINKLLHPPLESLRDESRHGIPHALMDALSRLFKLRE